LSMDKENNLKVRFNSCFSRKVFTKKRQISQKSYTHFCEDMVDRQKIGSWRVYLDPAPTARALIFNPVLFQSRPCSFRKINDLTILTVNKYKKLTS
jgi:hypothetical protein